MFAEESFSNFASGSGSGDNTDDTEPDISEEEGSGDSKHTHTFDPEIDNMPPIYPPLEPIIPVKPVSRYPNITSNEIPDSTNGNTRQEITLTRALFTYLFPIVVIWFGGMFTDLL